MYGCVFQWFDYNVTVVINKKVPLLWESSPQRPIYHLYLAPTAKRPQLHKKEDAITQIPNPFKRRPNYNFMVIKEWVKITKRWKYWNIHKTMVKNKTCNNV